MVRTPARRLSAGSFAYGTRTVSAFRTTRKLRPSVACGIARRIAVRARACSAEIRARYAREDALSTSSVLVVERVASVRPPEYAAGGGRRRVASNVITPRAWARGACTA